MPCSRSQPATHGRCATQIASNVAHPGMDRPGFDLNDTRAIADFVLDRTGLTGQAGLREAGS